jgi:ribosomal protein S3
VHHKLRVPRVRAAAEIERKFWIALTLYGILGAVVWFTLGEGTVLVLGRRVEIRWIPLFVIATFVFRTYLAREADKIRRKAGDGQGRL